MGKIAHPSVGDIVFVVWNDAFHSDGESMSAEHWKQAFHPEQCHSVGHFVFENDAGVMIATSEHQPTDVRAHDDYRDVLFVPFGMLVSMSIMRRKAKPATRRKP